MNVLYVQYAGDFAEAYKRLYIEKGKENYYGQKYSVDAVVQQANNNLNILVLTLFTNGYNLKLQENLVAVGYNDKEINYEKVFTEINNFNPDRVILRFPDTRILRFLRKNSIITFPVFADSFEVKGILRIRSRLNNYLLANELNKNLISWVANHQLNASYSLQNIGVNSKKIIPYDWEHSDNPSNWEKDIPANINNKKLNLFYAGSITIKKGVFDLIKSISLIKNNGRDVTLYIAGNGEIDSAKAIAENLNIVNEISFLGLISHEEVLKKMNRCDFVIVPSHHEYPEGLPMTIMESLMVHTPVIASNHPMFVGRVGKKGSVLFFKEKDDHDLAEKIMSASANLDAYKDMCKNAPMEWDDLVLELKWADMVNSWIAEPKKCDFSSYSLNNFVT